MGKKPKKREWIVFRITAWLFVLLLSVGLVGAPMMTAAMAGDSQVYDQLVDQYIFPRWVFAVIAIVFGFSVRSIWDAWGDLDEVDFERYYRKEIKDEIGTD